MVTTIIDGCLRKGILFPADEELVFFITGPELILNKNDSLSN
jgi:hypothetical protein